MTMSAENFFRQLPQGSLTPDENQLRGLLLDAAAVAARLLPRSGAVSLQQWVERRVPGDLVFTRDQSGFCNLRVARTATPSQAAPFKQNEDFLRSLPENCFSDNEMRLHDVIVECLQPGALPIQRLVNDGQVKLAKSWLPRGVLLEDWIEHRIGEEVFVTEGKAGEKMVKLKRLSKEERQSTVDAFFEDLPEDCFTEAETSLRNAILDVLDAKQGSAILSVIGTDKEVGIARKGCLVPGVSLKDWLERRLANELLVEEADKGQYKATLVEHFAAPPVDDRQSTGGSEQHDDREEEKRREQEEKVERREAFFADLPANDLAPEELELHEALSEFLDRWNSNTPPTLSQALHRDHQAQKI
jgi:hypothetical protein